MVIQANDIFSFQLEGTNGQGVVLVHGLTGIPGEMRFVAKQLHRMGYSVYAPLLRGHGVDTATLIRTRWEDWRDGLMEDIARYQSRVDSLFTAGICVGGKLGMLAADQMPDTVSACAIYSPCFNFDGWNTPWFYKLAPVGLPVALKFPWWRNLTYPETDTLGIKDERLRKFMGSADTQGVINEFPAQSLVQMNRLGCALKRKLADYKTPTLIMHAKDDDLSHPRNALYISHNIASPHTLEWVDDAYHMIHVDRSYAHVARRTAMFFDQYAAHTTAPTTKLAA